MREILGNKKGIRDSVLNELIALDESYRNYADEK